MVAGPLLFSLMSSWAHYTFVPALAGVLAAEAFAIRSILFHACNGAVCALIGWSLTRELREEQHFLSNPTVLVAAGIAAGFVYWLIAGSTAGFWKPLGAARAAPLTLILVALTRIASPPALCFVTPAPGPGVGLGRRLAGTERDHHHAERGEEHRRVPGKRRLLRRAHRRR